MVYQLATATLTQLECLLQNIEKESPLLSAYFINKLNEELGYNLTIPNESQQQKLL